MELSWPQNYTTAMVRHTGPTGNSWPRLSKGIGLLLRQSLPFLLNSVLQKVNRLCIHALLIFLLNQGKASMVNEERDVRVLNRKEFITQTVETVLRRPTSHQTLIHTPKPSICCLGYQKCLFPLHVCLENSYSSFKAHLRHCLLQTALIIPPLCYSETLHVHVLLFFMFAPFTTCSKTCFNWASP